MKPKEIPPKRSYTRKTKNVKGRPTSPESKRLKYKHEFVLNEPEEENFLKMFQESGMKRTTDFIRQLVFTDMRTVVLKDEKLDILMPHFIAVEKEINAIGVNYNQATKAINQQSKTGVIGKGLTEELIRYTERLETEIKKLLVHLDKFSEQWL